MNNILSNSFNIDFLDKKYEYKNDYKNYLILELYRSYLFKKLKKKLIKFRKKHLDKFKKKNPDIDINIKDNYIRLPYLIDIMSIFIINHQFKENYDVIFDSISPFNKLNIIKFLKEDKCLTTISNENINNVIDILPKLSKSYLKYFKKIKNCQFIEQIQFTINYNIIEDKVIILVEIKNNDKLNKLTKKLNIYLHIFKHLVKLYNTKILNNFISNDIIDNKVIEYIYILFLRYTFFSNGNNQASILPSFKKLLKTKLNIKVELFGSPLNTSNSIFCSLFYDIDYYFGSIGDYFNTNIIKGYYEINPPFDSCLINKIIDKSLKELVNAEINKLPLLFFFILPNSFFIKQVLPKQIFQYIKFNKLINKINFPYIRYNRNFNKTIVAPIVDTKLLILHTNYISNFVKYNVDNFNNIFDLWKK